VGERLAQQVFGVAGLRDDLEAALGEQADDAFSHEDVVLPDDHAD
jgi:hypothetical protein